MIKLKPWILIDTDLMWRLRSIDNVENIRDLPKSLKLRISQMLARCVMSVSGQNYDICLSQLCSLQCHWLTVEDADQWSGDHPGLCTQCHANMTASHRQAIVTDPTYHFLLQHCNPAKCCFQKHSWIFPLRSIWNNCKVVADSWLQPS